MHSPAPIPVCCTQEAHAFVRHVQQTYLRHRHICLRLGMLGVVLPPSGAPGQSQDDMSGELINRCGLLCDGHPTESPFQEPCLHASTAWCSQPFDRPTGTCVQLSLVLMPSGTCVELQAGPAKHTDCSHHVSTPAHTHGSCAVGTI